MKRGWWERAGLSEQQANLIQRVLRERELKWRGAHSTNSDNVAEKLNRFRFSAAKRRELLKQFQVPLPRDLTKEVMAHAIRGKSNSPLLDALYPRRSTHWRNVLRRDGREPISIRDFSFLEHPAKTLLKLAEIAEAEAVHANVGLNFDDDVCLDVGCFLVLEEMWRVMLPVFGGGAINHETNLS